MGILRRALGLAGRGGGSGAPRPDTLEGHQGALLPALAAECVLGDLPDGVARRGV